MNPHEPGSIPVMPSFVPPEPSDDKPTKANPAADVIRMKLASLYGDEPEAQEEIAEVKTVAKRSKHQDFMLKLSTSGKSLAQIQTDWHAYYTGLPDHEKHEVWQEFYAAQQHNSHYASHQSSAAASQPDSTDIQPEATDDKGQAAGGKIDTPDKRTVSDIKRQLLGKIDNRTRLKAKHHLKSLGFGLMMGSLSIIVLLFGFFNERFIAPFITPSKAVSSTPVIIDPNDTAVGPENKIIIPKINVEIPVVYDEPTIEEARVEKALERGVVHYATTPNPGERGNAVIFGHSSNNILNPGKYKFAFVLLSRMEVGDTFMLTKNGTRYVYKVYDKEIVKPTDVSVLDATDKVATATLITCDPPGTSLNRLIVIGEQISPDPAGDVASTAKTASGKPVILPSNAPSLWQRLTQWFHH